MSQITATPRITTERARELMAGSTTDHVHVYSEGMFRGLPMKSTAATSRMPRCDECGDASHSNESTCSAWIESKRMRTALGALRDAAPDLANDLLDARAECERWRAEYEALTQQVAARVDATEHARAVQEAWEDGASTQHAREQYCGKGRADTDFEWPASDSKCDLLATLARCLGAERAAALVDGGA